MASAPLSLRTPLLGSAASSTLPPAAKAFMAAPARFQQGGAFHTSGAMLPGHSNFENAVVGCRLVWAIHIKGICSLGRQPRVAADCSLRSSAPMLSCFRGCTRVQATSQNLGTRFGWLG